MSKEVKTENVDQKSLQPQVSASGGLQRGGKFRTLAFFFFLFPDLEAICTLHTVFGCCFPNALFPVLLSVLLFLHHVKIDENTCRRMPTPSTPEEL